MAQWEKLKGKSLIETLIRWMMIKMKIKNGIQR